MAAPLVAGAAGIILSLSNNTMGALEIKQVLLDTVEELPSLKGKVMSEVRFLAASQSDGPNHRLFIYIGASLIHHH